MKKLTIPRPLRLVLALAPALAVPAAAQGHDTFGLELSDTRLALLRSMPGQVGVGYGPYFHEDSQGRLLGTLQDRRGAPVLEFDLLLAMPLMPWVPTRGLVAEGWVIGVLHKPADAQGRRELVGVVQGRWVERQGYGELSALVFARGDDADHRRLAGVLAGRWRIEDREVPVAGSQGKEGDLDDEGTWEVPGDEPAGHVELLWKLFTQAG
jgi:hypothetical protein